MMSFNPTLRTLIPALLACACNTVSAQLDGSKQSPEAILATAQTYLEQAAAQQQSGRLEVTLGRLDPRLNLADCGQGLQAFQNNGARLAGNTSIGVRCPGPREWTVYLTANIKVFGPALVTTRSLARGAALALSDVSVVETELSALSYGHLDSVDEIQDLATLRALPAGTVLTPSMLKAPQLVRRGDRVSLRSGQGPIHVEMQGEAINSGARGDRVRVRALNSERVIEGWVVSASVVKVTL